MGGFISSIRNCVSPKELNHSQNTFLQILVVGDSGVGKSHLIDQFVHGNDGNEDRGGERDGLFNEKKDKNDERIRILNSSMMFRKTDNASGRIINHNVSITIVDINGEIDNIAKQIRESYYKTSNIIFIIYNVGNVKSLKHAKTRWHKELEAATSKNSKNNTQLVLVGVNPELREKYTESEVSVLDDNFSSMKQSINDDDIDDPEDISNQNTKRKRKLSVKKEDGDSVAKVLKYRNSTKKTKHREVKSQRGSIYSFFQEIVNDYIHAEN